jgi:hypothetical protein
MKKKKKKEAKADVSDFLSHQKKKISGLTSPSKQRGESTSHFFLLWLNIYQQA